MGNHPGASLGMFGVVLMIGQCYFSSGCPEMVRVRTYLVRSHKMKNGQQDLIGVKVMGTPGLEERSGGKCYL